MRTTLLTTLTFLSTGCLGIHVPDAARAYNDECAVLFTRGEVEQADRLQITRWSTSRSTGTRCTTRASSARRAAT